MNQPYLPQMVRVSESNDPEQAHFDGDAILIEIVRAAGYNEVADLWMELEKWYA